MTDVETLRTTVTGPCAHLCPFVDEVDLGTYRAEFSGEANELHGMRRFVESFKDRRVTHEALTQALADEFDAPVTTYWYTAGMGVEVSAVPGDISA